MELLDALKRPEGKTLEFKRDLSSPEGIMKTIVAFANTAGGTIFLGIDDATRNVRGVHDPLRDEERLANLVSDSILPRLVPDIELLPWRRTNVLRVEVYPSPGRPHHLSRVGPRDGVYVRVGSTNRRADRQLVEELGRTTRGEAFDEQPMPELGAEAIDFRAASDCFATMRKLRRSDLETLRILVPHQGRKVPSVGGLLLFGTDRARHFPDAWIQAGRFDGTDKARILDHAEIRSLPLPAIEAAIAFVGKHGIHGAAIGAVRRSESWSLPPAAVREAVVNAVAHSDYSQRGAPIRISLFDDRLEVESPGLLPFGLTVDDLRRGVSKLRNRVIGRVLHELGLMEQWGSGIQRMTAACRESGLEPPELEEIATRFRVTIHTTRNRPIAVGPVDQTILDSLSTGAGLSTQKIAAAIGRTPRATRNRLARLVESGLLLEIGSSPQDPRKLYYLAAPLANRE